MRSSLLAATTMGQLQKKLDIVGQNMANANTTGYKAKTANFSSLLTQQINQPNDQAPRQTPEGIRQGTGARLGHTNLRMTAGSLQQTDRPLDVALTNENQYFQVQVTNNGATETQYTRAGNLYLQPVNNNEQVMLVSAEGNPLMGQNGPIMIAGGMDNVEIQDNGNIVVTRGQAKQVEDTLDVVQINRPRSLESAGGNRYRFPNGPEAGMLENVADLNLQVGALESSNVNLGEEMTSMLEIQRAYQFNSQSISIGDQMSSLINQLRR
ncbi:flagellar hook-basal body protein [Salinibacillus xinjiangensis]|uniref:Flagellar hook-basal body complex protein n=1 Tax=Salinibacillus xinjiangensis TaxID=1229268 RepID=A0A6G1X593_9BACI|nr:flagellar hook-basal body protein [Salinibacillus xinjiangensis]MRG86171.1 flagellar hook-basal body complex protein [Salinibacillus xinjiangensis]